MNAPVARTSLRIYVNDHRAAAAGGVALARRALRNNEGTLLGAELLAIVGDLLEDAATLEMVAHRLSIPDNRVKHFLVRATEAFTRMKPNGRVLGYSPLSRLLELEALRVGIDAKRSLWKALGASVAESLPELDFAILVARATDQRRRLEPYHRAAAENALSTDRL